MNNSLSRVLKPGTFFILVIIHLLLGALFIAVLAAPAEMSVKIIITLLGVMGQLGFIIILGRRFIRRANARLSENLKSLSTGLGEDIQTLEKRQEELESILEHIREGVVVIDSNERILIVNRQALNLFFISEDPASCEGRSIIDIFRSSNFSGSVEKILEEQRLLAAPIQVWDSSHGRHRILNMRGVFIDPADEPRARILIVLHDVTELIRLEQVRKDFVSNVSHELKTPITAIQGFAETLLDRAIDDQNTARNFIQIILDQSRRMREIVSDLLTLSKIEQQERQIPDQDNGELRFINVDIEKLIQESIDLLGSSPTQPDISVHSSVDGSPIIRLNPLLFEQTFINLIDNAVRYGGEKVEVWITVKRINDAVEIRIEDNGPGIPQRYLPRIFERFYRVDLSNSIDGTGLGLAIVKHIIQAHGGTISVSSQVGSGTVFIITLPQPPQALSGKA